MFLELSLFGKKKKNISAAFAKCFLHKLTATLCKISINVPKNTSLKTSFQNLFSLCEVAFAIKVADNIFFGTFLN